MLLNVAGTLFMFGTPLWTGKASIPKQLCETVCYQGSLWSVRSDWFPCDLCTRQSYVDKHDEQAVTATYQTPAPRTTHQLHSSDASAEPPSEPSTNQAETVQAHQRGKDNGKTPSQGPCQKPGYVKLSCEAAAWAGATNEWEKEPTKEDEFVVDYVRVYEGTLPAPTQSETVLRRGNRASRGRGKPT